MIPLPKYRQTPFQISRQFYTHRPCFSDPVVELELELDADVDVASLQPHHPGVSQVAEDEGDGLDDDVAVELGVELAGELVMTALLLVAGISEVGVTIGAGAAEGEVMVVVRVMVLGSLQPNQPGVLQVVVVSVLVIVFVEVVDVVVVDSSRQPHQPGVLQVSVRVCEVVLEETVDLLVVVSLLLLSKNVQLKQSWQSVSSSQLGTVSYFSSTSLITLTMRWVPTPARQPRSPTVS
jgi:hypothetical protein